MSTKTVDSERLTMEDVLHELHSIYTYMDEKDAHYGFGQIDELINKIEASETKEEAGRAASDVDALVRLRRATITHYWSDDHTPYRFMLRDSETDENFNLKAKLEDAFKKLAVEDGDEIEIVVKKTGNRPFGNRKVRLVEPHTYKREPVAT